MLAATGLLIRGIKLPTESGEGQPRWFYFHNFVSGSVKWCLSKYVFEGRVSPMSFFWEGFPFCFSLLLFPKKCPLLRLQIQENISSVKLTQAQSTCALHAAVTLHPESYMAIPGHKKLKELEKSMYRLLPGSKILPLLLANISFFPPNTECNPLWISQSPSLRVKLTYQLYNGHILQDRLL